MNFLTSILGTPDYLHFLGVLLFALIGAYLSINFEANKRDIRNPKTPTKFSYRTLFIMNWKRLFATFLAIFVLLRFGKDITGLEFTEFGGFMTGLGIDRFMLVLKNYNSKRG